MPTFLESFALARRAAAPLVAVQTPDIEATMQTITHWNHRVFEAFHKDSETEAAVIMQDCVRGITGLNKNGKALAAGMNGADPTALANPVEALVRALKQMPPSAILFMANPHLFFREPQVIQGLWNLRNGFKSNSRTLVLVGHGFTIPREIAGDVVVLDEPLPDAAQLRALVMQTYNAVGIKPESDDIISRAEDALCGLPAFGAETSLAMSIRKSGLDLNHLWEQKRHAIEQTMGLSIGRSPENFTNVTGLDNCKGYHLRRGNGPRRRRGLVFIDEIDKHLAGFGAVGTGDTTTEMVGALLTEMQDMEAEGSLFLGVAGSGKTLIARAIANEWGVPLINYDLSGMKASHVGESGQNIRAANKVVRAITQGNVYYIATCNRIENLPPELRRRFTSATFFFDLMTRSEKDSAWDLYEKKFNVTGNRPADQGWTAAEIRNCCYNADVLACSLEEAAKYIVPISVSAKDQIEMLRRQADGKFISASYSGVYHAPEGVAEPEDHEDMVVAVGIVKGKKHRNITTDDEPVKVENKDPKKRPN